jgi:acylphosphatase
MVIISGKVIGKVQGVMFRQTFIRCLIAKKMEGGATNSANDSNEVTFTISGKKEIIDKVLLRIQSLPELNSWGATVSQLVILDKVIPVEFHEVTTSNVDNFKWSPNVTFYL